MLWGRSLVALLACATSACALDLHDLDAFRKTATGPQKLHAVVRDETRSASLRAHAALRLLELERSDADGPLLLLSALKQSSSDARYALSPAFERGLLARMATAAGHAPSTAAIRAKDVAVELLPLLEAHGAQQLGVAVLAWIGEDIERRADSGSFSLEEIAGRVGKASAAPTAQSVRPGLVAKSLARLTESIDKHADTRMRESAASKIVEVERSYRALPGKERDLLTYALPALGRFVDSEAARVRLVAIAAEPQLGRDERELALRLLAQHAAAADIAPLSAVALDPATELPLRELALARIGETAASEALPTLLVLCGERTHRALRQRAAELAIDIGGERALPGVFSALPSHWNVAYAKSELEAYAARVERLEPTPSLVGMLSKKLYSPYWWNRIVALHYFANRASPAAATWRLRLHVDDEQEVVGEGWPPHWTVGKEARVALGTVAAR